MLCGREGRKKKRQNGCRDSQKCLKKMAFPCVFGHADPTVAIIASSPSAWMLAKKAVHTHLHSLHELRSAGGRTLQPSVFCNRGFGRTSAFATRPSRSERSPAAHQAWIWISDQIRLKDASFHSFHSHAQTKESGERMPRAGFCCCVSFGVSHLRENLFSLFV